MDDRLCQSGYGVSMHGLLAEESRCSVHKETGTNMFCYVESATKLSFGIFTKEMKEEKKKLPMARVSTRAGGCL